MLTLAATTTNTTRATTSSGLATFHVWTGGVKNQLIRSAETTAAGIAGRRPPPNAIPITTVRYRSMMVESAI